MDATARWPQGIGVVKGAAVEKKPRPNKEEAVNCPRCSSTNTKFCYYNNYSLSQPRYFCKTCRRYWTEGGSLRNVPVGGGSRKNKRPSSSNHSSSSPSTNSSKKILHQDQIFSPQNPKIQHGHDLNLAYNPFSQFVALPFGIDSKNMILENPNFSMNMSSAPPSAPPSALSIPVSSGDHGSSPSLIYTNNNSGSHNSSNNSSVFANLHDHFIKPTLLGFSLDGLENGSYGNLQGLDHDQDHHHSSHVHGVPSSKMLFPFEELKTDSRNDREFGDHHQQEMNRGQNGDQSNGYWTGMLAGGSW